MSSSSPLLSVRGLTVSFDDFVAVDGLSFDLHEGETAVSYTHLTLPTNREV